MACGDIVKDTRDITRFSSDSYIWNSKGEKKKEEEEERGEAVCHTTARPTTS